jgi:hypothetical protein
MKQHDKPLSFAERVKEHSPLWFEYARRHGMTPEQYQTIEDKHERAWRKKQRTSLLPFPLPDNYKNDGDSRLPRDALEAVSNYRLLLQRFGPDCDEDEDQLKKATDVALGIRLAWSDEWNLELAEVPFTKDSKRPTDEDFARLEQWFLTAANTTEKEIASHRKAALSEGGQVLPWGRAILAFAVVIVAAVFAVIAAWLWGQGDNLLQKIGNCGWLFVSVFTVAVPFCALILGRIGWSHVMKMYHWLRGEA